MRGRGRPRAFDRDAALAEAMRLFWRKGYAATSIADLTEAMGIGAPSLYAAFASKEALYTEALRHYGAQFEPRIWGGFDTAPTLRAAIEALLMDTASALTQGCGAGNPRGCMVTLSAAGAEGSTELADFVQAARAAGLERVRKRIDAAACAELPEGADPDVLARLVLALHGGMSLQARDGADAEELAGVARVAMTLWDAAVAQEQPAG